MEKGRRMNETHKIRCGIGFKQLSVGESFRRLGLRGEGCTKIRCGIGFEFRAQLREFQADITVTEFFTNFEATRACTTRFSFLCSFSANTQPFLTVNRAACSTLKRLSSLFPR
jgi:hypothetical protein